MVKTGVGGALTGGGANPVAAILVEDHQQDGHDHDDADHDDGVEDGVEKSAANVWSVLGERRVDPVETNVTVSCKLKKETWGGGHVDLQLLVGLLRVEAD